MKSNIAKLRKQNGGMKQRELAEKLHVSQQTISRGELNRSQIEIDLLINLADFFAVSTDQVLDYRPEMPVIGIAEEACGYLAETEEPIHKQQIISFLQSTETDNQLKWELLWEFIKTWDKV